MLTLLIGRAGSGKSSRILEEMRKNGAERKQLLLVPEQASHEAERRLCEQNGNTAGRYAEVLSFTRLENRVLSYVGGLAEPTLDAGGRLLLMYASLQAVRSHLSVYAMPSRKPEFLSSLLATVDELKSYCISAAALAEVAEQTDGMVGSKLGDLALIYGAYEAMRTQGRLDPRDRLTRLAEKLKSSDFVREKDIYIDGFTDFTPQEGEVIRALCRSHSLTVALNCDHLEEDEHGMGIFSPARRTGAHLIQLAQRSGIPYTVEVCSSQGNGRSPALTTLEQVLFSDKSTVIADEEGRVKCYAAASAREEVIWAAEHILELVQKKGLRYRDIAVVARSFEGYQDWVEGIFTQYRIPVFQSAMTDVLQKPIFALITAALDTVNGNYTYDDVFRYLKTDLTALSREDCDALENYVLTWNIKGSKWTSAKGWSMHPNGYHQKMEQKDLEYLEYLNHLRRQVIEPLEELRKNGCRTIGEQVLSLYSFLQKIGVPEKLTERTEQLLARGEPELAQEYEQLWQIFCEALEQCDALLGEMPADLEEFARLLRLLLSQYEVGSIPASLDRVTTGDAPRLANRHVKALFFLGADDASIPLVAPASGLLNDRDRELLSDFGLDTAPRMEEKVYREMTIAYMSCTQASEFLFMTWPKVGEQGAERRPSFLAERIRTLFPTATTDTAQMQDEKSLILRLSQTPEGNTFLEQMPDYTDFLRKVHCAKVWTRGQLSRPVAEQLYGAKVAMSASRMDNYKSCHFAYYMKYGLRAKERKQVGFDAPEYGTFIHFVLEHVLREAQKKGGVKKQTQAAWKDFAKQAVRQYVKEELGGLEQQTARFRYLFHRLERAVLSVVENVTEELMISQFEPIAFEVGFGKGNELAPVELEADGVTLSISGFVDRVDGWVKDGRLYLRIVDYKTGRKSFDLTEIWNGLGLQMLLYLFALEDKGEAFFGQTIHPAGVLYLPAREAVIAGSRSMSEEIRRTLMDKELVRKGLLLEDPAVLEAMEPPEGGIRFLPLRVSAKTGSITGDALVSAQKLGRLKQHIERILTQICKELAGGTIAADPFWRGPTNNACLYCSYAQACHFEEGQDEKRWIPSVRNRDFWTYIEQEEQDGV